MFKQHLLIKTQKNFSHLGNDGISAALRIPPALFGDGGLIHSQPAQQPSKSYRQI